MKLQLKLLLPIICLFALLLGLNSFFAYRESAKDLELAIKANMEGEAEPLARSIQFLAVNSIADALRTAEHASVLEFYRAGTYYKEEQQKILPILRSLQDSYADFDRITLLDLEGKVVASSQPEVSKPGDSFADRDYVQEALAGRPYLSKPLISRISGRPILAASAPVKLDGKIVGAAYAAISLDDFFKNWIAPIKIGQEGFAYIINAEGLVVMARNQDWIMNPSLPAVSLYKKWTSSGQESGFDSYRDKDGRTTIYHYKTDPQTKLTAVIQAEEQDVYSGLHTLRNNSLLFLAAGIFLGVLAIIIIVRPITRALARGVVYAKDVASGKLDGQLDVRRNDEIGQLADALRSIPVSLKNIIAEYQTLENRVEQGDLSAQGDTSRFSGDFASLIKGTNSILTRYRTVLDNLPSPVVMLSKDLKASYLNTVAQELAGSDYQGKTCHQMFKRDDFGSNTCALTKAVNTRQKASAETQAHPQGKTMDISYTAIPMLDSQGNLASVLQLLTDLTAVKNTQRIIIDVAHQALDISHRVATASQELSAQVEQVNRGTEVQRDRVNSTATAMEEMNTTVLEVAKNAGEAREQAETTQNKARHGAELVKQVIEAIGQVDRVARELDNNMRALGNQADSIGGVMNVISDIADQTNLLALNAAIEAARAGEAGRGFAVVADEVRKLAEKTMSATSEVGSSITGIQTATSQNIDRVAQATERVSKATEIAGASGEALSEILGLANENASLIAGIATAAEEQSATSEEINHAVEEINRIAAEISSGMQDSANAVQDLAKLAQDLQVLLDRLHQ